MAHGDVWSTTTPRGVADGLISNTGGWEHSDPDPSLDIWDAINSTTDAAAAWKDEYITVEMFGDDEVIEFSIEDIPAPMAQPGVHVGPRLHTLEMRASSSDGGDDGSCINCELYQGTTRIDGMGCGSVPTYPSNSRLLLYLDSEVDNTSTPPHGGSFPTADATSKNYEDLRIRLTASDPEAMGVTLYVFWTHFDCADDTSTAAVDPIRVALNFSGSVSVGGPVSVTPDPIGLAVNFGAPGVVLGSLAVTPDPIGLAVNLIKTYPEFLDIDDAAAAAVTPTSLAAVVRPSGRISSAAAVSPNVQETRPSGQISAATADTTLNPGG